LFMRVVGHSCRRKIPSVSRLDAADYLRQTNISTAEMRFPSFAQRCSDNLIKTDSATGKNGGMVP
jgi:hypothetical protein